MQECLEWSEESSKERTMISRCANWMWRCSRVCVCAGWLIEPPLTRHFHYLIAWKGGRGDCRSLVVRAKRMDLECISIGSKAPAVGGCPRPVGPSRRCRWAVLPPASAAPPPHPSVPSVRACFIEKPSNCTGPTRGVALSPPVILMFTGNSNLPHILLKPYPTVPLL